MPEVYILAQIALLGLLAFIVTRFVVFPVLLAIYWPVKFWYNRRHQKSKRGKLLKGK